jgi:hypothetical protein
VASEAVSAGGGVALVRFRQRGPAVECTVGDILGPVSARDAGRAVRSAVRSGGADYAIASTAQTVGGMVKAPRLGPILTRRAVTDRPNTLPLALSLGDLELF